jgi:hypothetical protein
MFDRVAVLSLCFVSAISLTACSSSDDSAPTTDGGGDTAKVDTGATDTKVSFDSAPGDTTPPICWFVTATKPEEKKCDDCSNVKCNAERQVCYGPGYLDGKTFGGTCKDYITCQCGCLETDAVCQENCKISSPTTCQDCEAKIADCEKAKCPTECTPTL